MMGIDHDNPTSDAAPGERPASEHLAALGATGQWEQRAEWLETEAKAQREPAARARLLLAASEVRALLGNRADARRLAIQAANHQPAPPFAARQARALHHTHGDVSAVTRSLVEETRAAESPALEAHGHYVAAEIQRLLQRDPNGARLNLDAAIAANPSDGRAPLQQLLLELSSSQRPPEVTLAWQQPEALASAVQVLRRLRGEPGEPPPREYVAAVGLVDVQRALARKDLAAAARALEPLAARAELLPAVRWMEALWATAADGGTDGALAAHRALVQHQPGFAARRALAARAVAANSWEALQEALREPPETSATGADADSSHVGTRAVFSNVERAALAALVGQRPASATAASASSSPPLDSTEEPAVGSIVLAVERASHRPSNAAALQGRAAAEFALGRALSSPEPAAMAGDEVGSARDAAAAPWTLVSALERSRASGDWSAVARDLPRLLEAPVALAEACFVAAVFAERAGDADAAQRAFGAALPSPSTREPATRALTETSGDGAAALRALSAHTVDPLRRALLLTEALFRLDPTAPEFDSLAEDAARTHAELPFAVELGAAAARSRGDRQRAARWLARRREHAQGADDYPLAALREALATLDVDLPGATDRLHELMARYPDDLTLFLSCERLLDLGPRPRAELRRRLAATLAPRGRIRFLAEAVKLYEAAGERALALGQARELGGSLGELWAARLASSDTELDELAHEWHRAAQRTPDAALAADLYDRLARLERRRGREERALAWQRERLAVEPGSLEALRALELHDMARGREAPLEQTAVALFEALGERDGAAHAFVATRLQIARGALADARPLVRRMHATAIPPLWALRLDAVFAREADDDQALLATCRRLRERSSQALDAATLSLHAAEAALRLGERGLAKDDILRASELAPDDIVILSARAEVLLENGDHAEAAEAFETLASATSSTLRQVDALYQAAVLWLDRLGNRPRGMLALQEAAQVGVPHAGLLERLVALHAQSDDPDGLAELIARQRACAARASNADADVELSRALEHADQGRLTQARSQLDALLELRPDDIALLQASAQLHRRASQWTLAERDWLRVLELDQKVGRGDGALSALRHLSALYETELPRPEQLALIYQRITSQDPEDHATRERLIALLSREERWAEAAGQQRELLARASNEAERKTRLLALAQLTARAGSLHPNTSELTEAESLLEQARRTWPDDPGVLEAELTHYVALGNEGTARVIAERAAHAARSAITAGRIETAPFRTLEVAARWCADTDTALAAGAMAAAIAGERAAPLPGAGGRAGDAELDELTAPEALAGELRRLLLAAGSAIERAYAIEPRSLNARAAPDELVTELRALALAFGLDRVRVLISPDLGVDCWCLGTDPVCIVLGEPLVARADRALLTFLVLRALKIAAANACALSRLSPSECWAALAGFFACFGQPWPATGVDAQRLLLARNRIRPHVTWLPEPDLSARLSTLMEEVLPRAEELGAALFQWGTRVALLGVGDPSVALEALFVSDPRGWRPTDEEGRVRWIAGQRAARDLVSYGVSEAYMEARRRAGLGAVAASGHPGPHAP